MVPKLKAILLVVAIVTLLAMSLKLFVAKGNPPPPPVPPHQASRQ